MDLHLFDLNLLVALFRLDEAIGCSFWVLGQPATTVIRRPDAMHRQHRYVAARATAMNRRPGHGTMHRRYGRRDITTLGSQLRRLAPNVYAYTQASGPGVDNASLSNAGVVAGPEGLLAIDTLGPPIHAKAFKSAAQTATGKPFDRVINTHHHRDHTNGNCFFSPVRSSPAYTRGRLRSMTGSRHSPMTPALNGRQG